MTVDNTTKPDSFSKSIRSNKNPAIDVNTSIPHQDRRVPIDQMIYVADGPSDVPVFAVVKQMGGKPMPFTTLTMKMSLFKHVSWLKDQGYIIMVQRITVIGLQPRSGLSKR